MAKKHKGFDRMTFDSWFDSLNEEELDVLSDHLISAIELDDGGRVLLWSDKESVNLFPTKKTDQVVELMKRISTFAVSVFPTETMEAMNEIHKGFMEAVKEAKE